MRMHVILTTDVYHPFMCGVTRVVDTFLQELPRYSIRVSVLAPARIGPAFMFFRRDSVCRIYVRSFKLRFVYPEARAPEPTASYFAARRLFRRDIYVSDDRFIIHAHTPYIMMTFMRIYANMRGLKPPIVLTYHTLVRKFLEKKFGSLSKLLCGLDCVHLGNILRRARAIIAPTKYAETAFLRSVVSSLRRLTEKIIRIPNPLSRSSYDKPSKSVRDVLDGVEEYGYAIWVGRISHEKNIPFLVRIFKNTPYRLIIVGRGPLLERFRKASPPNVTFLGFVDDNTLRTLLHYARCFVVASSFDNMPLAVMEAMAQGVPVVSYYLGGHNEYLKHGKNGFKFRRIGEAQTYIDALFRDDDLRDALGFEALKTAQMFHPDRVIPKHIELYDRYAEHVS